MKKLWLPVFVLAAGCGGTSELVPLFDSLIALPLVDEPACGDDVFVCCVLDGGCDEITFTIRNVGDKTLILDSLSFEGDAPNFDGPESDVEVLPAEGQAAVRFRYITPDLEPQTTTIVIRSDATVNPELTIDVSTVVPVPDDGGPPAPQEDAGVPPEVDAGTPPQDAGAIEDAGVAQDAGRAQDAGTDAGDAG